MWTRFYDRYGDLGRPVNFERCLSAMLAHKPVKALRPDPGRIREEFREGAPTYARLFALFHQHYAEQLGRPRWGDQLGFVEHYADVIFAAYPDARMIHTLRDPRDRYAASIAGSRRRPGALGAATARWLHSAALARRNQQRYPDRYKVVRFETLVSRFEETLRDICAFLGEEFVSSMLTLEGALRFGDASDDGWDGAPDPGAAPDGQGETTGADLSGREIAFIQAEARHDMAAFGYEPAPVRLSLPERLLFHTVDWPVNLAGMVAWRVFLAGRLA
jgi:hypothetical protein